MIDMAGTATPATTVLDRSGVSYRLHTYVHAKGTTRFGEEAADVLTARLGVDAVRILKTLVITASGGAAARPFTAVAVLPVTATLSTKAAAAALGAGRAAMADPAVARRATGYVLGGVSPLGPWCTGARPALPTVVDESVAAADSVFCSGGRRGLEIEIAPADLIALTGAVLTDLTR